MPDDVEMAVLTADVRRPCPVTRTQLAAALARYVVLTRDEPACRNVDLVASATQSGRFLVIEKWDSADARPGPPRLPAHDRDGRGRASRSLADEARRSTSRPISAHDLRVRLGAVGALRYFWRRRSTGTFEGPRSAAPVSLQISRMPAHVMRRRVPAALERGVGDVGEAVLEPEVVELALAPDRDAEALGPADRVDVPGDPLAARRAPGRAARRRSRRRAGPWRAATSPRGRVGPGRRENVRGRRLSSRLPPEIQSDALPSTTSVM